MSYDDRAAAYARKSDTSPYNALYDRPAVISLLPDVAGKHVFDAGCGGGPLSAWLLEQGAHVTGCDKSAGLIAYARERLGDGVTLHVHDLSKPLHFLADGGQDVVVASLVMHYLADWEAVLGEFHRVLKPDGLVVFSTHHPVVDWRLFERPDYFAQELLDDEWMVGGEPFNVQFYRRPLTAMFAAFRAAGFVVGELLEPRPVPEMAELYPDTYTKLTTQPWFICFRLRKNDTA